MKKIFFGIANSQGLSGPNKLSASILTIFELFIYWDNYSTIERSGCAINTILDIVSVIIFLHMLSTKD